MSDLAAQWENAFQEMPLIAILRGIQPEECLEIAQSLVNAGMRILEVPLNSPQPFESIKILTAAFPDHIVGAGTVTTPEQVKCCIDCDCKLIVAPNFNPAIAYLVKQAGMIYCPGVVTPTEVFSALEHGADGLKLFPAEMIGPDVIKAMRSVLPVATKIIPVGGISAGIIESYLTAGANGFGIGSAIYKPGKTAEDVRIAASDFIGKYQQMSASTRSPGNN